MTLLHSKAHRLVWPMMATALVVSWSSGFVGIRYTSENADVMLVLFWRTLMSGLILLPFALLIGPRIGARALVEQMVFGVAMMFLYLGGFALAIGQRVPTGLVALISDLVPLAIAALSQPVLGQRLTGRQWIGTALGVT
ncbi:EamA family transporter, partial [Mesorhizobium sp. M4A.F.Ca.ET.029.04.2.1]